MLVNQNSPRKVLCAFVALGEMNVRQENGRSPRRGLPPAPAGSGRSPLVLPRAHAGRPLGPERVQ